MPLTRTLTCFCFVLMAGLFLLPVEAEAKRFGGGGSFGKSFTTQKKVAPQPAQRTSDAQTRNLGDNKAAAPARRPGMGGLLGGLLAGGLLGALFFGGAFEGIQMMDILLIAVLAFVAFKLFGRMARQGAKGSPQPSYAAGPGADPVNEPVQARSSGSFQPTPLMSATNLGEDALKLPSWFQRDAFVEGARSHFTELQHAWSANDLETIQTYCTAELYQSLKDERNKLGNGVLDNDLVSVMVDLVGYSEEAAEARLSVNFYGWMREGQGNDTTEFNEVWHLTRDLSVDNSDWFIAGIEQV